MKKQKKKWTKGNYRLHLILYHRFHGKAVKRLLLLGLCLLLLAGSVLVILPPSESLPAALSKTGKTIRWVDFNVPYSALEKAMKMDIESYGTETHLDWIEMLAFLATKYGGEFSRYQAKDLDQLGDKLEDGEFTAHLSKALNEKSYQYYLKAYTAVLGGFLGEFDVQVPVKNQGDGSQASSGQDQAGSGHSQTSSGQGQDVSDPSSSSNSQGQSVAWQKKYGLKAFSPIADGYWYSDYDDFGVGRSYGYARKHFGHDLMISVGTPVIAVESGVVEALGWNQYGGWRIGLRSFDGTRYYYYAHLRKDRPYAKGLYQGKAVKAGDVIGYSGCTGYSIKENVNNIDTPHLHYGMQLIFDPKEKDSPNQIWVDLYSITRLLSRHKSQVIQNPKTKEYQRLYDISEPSYYQNDLSPQARTAVSQELNASKVPENTVPVPIIMYHSLLKDKNRQNKFVIDPALFENDLNYLKQNGYTTLLMTDLIQAVSDGTPLPEKPIILTFDDGYYNNYLYAYPMLKKYNMKALISIIGRYTDEYSQLHEDNANYSHITWDQANEMIASGLVEIQNHTYDMHTYNKGRKGCKQNPGETQEVYRSVMDSDVGKLQKRIFEKTHKLPNTFTYPFGYMSDGSGLLLKDMGFQATLSCSEGINYISTKEDHNPDQLFRLKRCLRPPHKSSQEFFQNLGIR